MRAQFLRSGCHCQGPPLAALACPVLAPWLLSPPLDESPAASEGQSPPTPFLPSPLKQGDLAVSSHLIRVTSFASATVAATGHLPLRLEADPASPSSVRHFSLRGSTPQPLICESLSLGEANRSCACNSRDARMCANSYPARAPANMRLGASSAGALLPLDHQGQWSSYSHRSLPHSCWWHLFTVFSAFLDSARCCC